MKKLVMLVLSSLLAASMAWAGATPGTGVVGSKHDLRALAGGTDERVCAFCHTPHHADVTSFSYMPLWSHEVTAETFTQYFSQTFDGWLSIVDPVTGPSVLCMSCHDGAVAPDAYYGKAGSVTPEGDAYGEYGIGLGGDMTNDHPIGFNYEDAMLDTNNATPEIRDADADLTTVTDIAAQVGHIGTIRNLLFDDDFDGTNETFTCASCHDVHNGPSVKEDYFLYADQNDSAFCRMCHIK